MFIRIITWLNIDRVKFTAPGIFTAATQLASARSHRCPVAAVDSPAAMPPCFVGVRSLLPRAIIVQRRMHIRRPGHRHPAHAGRTPVPSSLAERSFPAGRRFYLTIVVTQASLALERLEAPGGGTRKALRACSETTESQPNSQS